MSVDENIDAPFKEYGDDPLSDMFGVMDDSHHVEFSTGVDQEDFEPLVGLDAIREAYIALSAECKKEALTVLPDIPSAAEICRSQPTDREMVTRGIVVKTIIPEAARRAQYIYGSIQNAGSEVRTSRVTPSRLTLVDQKVAVVSANAAGILRTPIAYRTRVDGAVSSLHALFETLWEQATPFFLEMSMSAEPLGEREYLVLSGLVAGWSDEEIARLIGLGPRTVQRVLREIADTLNAESRTALAVEAYKHGIPPAKRKRAGG